MTNPLIILIKCSLFLFIPMGIFGIGLWLIKRYFGFEHKGILILGSGLFGAVFATAAFVGMMIDPRSPRLSILEILATSIVIGVVAMLSALVIVSIYQGIIRALK